ncbi:MAG TPA: c-type cytochrome [Thermodesulfobacteriota bacterium]|nr:c-type cytochrome [Thermodesulfobacteriota bacterium]
MMSKLGKLMVCLMVIVFMGSTVFAFTADQATKGKELYVKYCAVCHGANGEGGKVPEQFGKLAGMKVPPVAGPGYLPNMKSAGQAYEFAMKNMPGDKPGSLKSEEYLDIISFALQANGIAPDDKPLTPASAKKIKLAGGEKKPVQKGPSSY